MAGRQWHLGGGWVAMFIIGGLMVPRSLGGVGSISGGDGNL